ncbi:MAG: glycoside hydrolase family 3 protein, partial [Proteobacteria bacterium]
MKTCRALSFGFLLLGLGCAARAPAANEGGARIEKLVGALTPAEKISLVSGNFFDTTAIPRLNIPSIKMTDGPVGVRGGPHTAFPAAINLGASWNPALVREVAAAIADEAKDAGKNMVLGPCVNIARHPFGGRNFESFGEDPLLNASLGEEYVRGVQGQGVLASVKHFAVNDQEIERDTIDTIVSRRALFELHLPAFQAAVDAGCGSVMSSYNKVNGHWASENHELLTNILK